jgi:hypothetical protein
MKCKQGKTEECHRIKYRGYLELKNMKGSLGTVNREELGTDTVPNIETT